MPVSWTPETHETLLVAILKSGGAVDPKAIIAAWPGHKGQPPTLSALTQHITGLKKKVGANSVSGNSSATTPVPRSTTKKVASGTFGNTPKSRGRPAKNTLFSGSAAKATRAANDSDDSEGDTCASTASPTPATVQKGSKKRVRKQQEDEEEGREDTPVDIKKGNAFIDQLRAAASQAGVKVKQEPAWSTESLKKKAKIEGEP